MRANIEAVVFDLDGTLIDSAPGILSSFEAAFSQHGITPLKPWQTGLIGPPLLHTIAKQCDSQDHDLLDALRAAFVACYDSGGYRLSTPYPGIDTVLLAMQSLGIRMFVATNKRIAPTQLILEHLGWNTFFEGVFGVDSFLPSQTSKADVIRRICQHFGLTASRSWYVGDRVEDYEAASLAGLPFVLAVWGFGGDNPHVPLACQRLYESSDLLRFIDSMDAPQPRNH